jgi:uncharacterized protein YjbI with pentapeptide repeats
MIKATHRSIWPRNLFPMSAAEVLDAYSAERRRFAQIELDEADFAGVNLREASFIQPSLIRANFEDAIPTHVQRPSPARLLSGLAGR